MGIISDLKGTLATSFRIKNLILDAVNLTASRTVSVPDKAGTLAFIDDIGLGKNRLINGNFTVNQRVVTGTVTLAAGVYGHDRWKAGASGCTYTFSASEGITTLTITAGSLIQIIESSNVPLGTNTCVLSWTGTAQGKIGADSYSDSGVTASVTGGTNLSIEFNTGTLSLVQFEKGSGVTSFEQRMVSVELGMCKYYYEQYINTSLVAHIASGFILSTTTAFFLFTYTNKRAQPAVTVTNNWLVETDTTITPTALIANQVNIDRCRLQATGTFTSGQVGNGCLLIADGVLGRIIKISAEL